MPRRNRRADAPPPLSVRLGPDRRAQEVCAAKERFATEAEARAIALMHVPGRGSRSAAYRCDVCGGWHLTRAA